MLQGMQDGSRECVLGQQNPRFGCLKTVNSGKLKNILILFSYLIPTGTKCLSLKRKYRFFFPVYSVYIQEDSHSLKMENLH